MMIDYNGKLWMFGYYANGQILMNGKVNRNVNPIQMDSELFDNHQIERIKCGTSHNYLKCNEMSII